MPIVSNIRVNVDVPTVATPATDGVNVTYLVDTRTPSVTKKTLATSDELDLVTAGVYHVEAFGAVGDGVTDDGPAWQSAIAAALAAGGGIVAGSAKVYLIGQTLDPGTTAPITLAGVGWKSNSVGDFADANWAASVASGAICGTVLHFTDNTIDAIDVGGVSSGRNFCIHDLAIIGPGAGTTAALCFATTTGPDLVSFFLAHNVLVANWHEGLRLKYSYDNSFYDLNCYGCATGVHIAADTTETKFYGLRCDHCGTAWLAEHGADLRVYGGLIQNCTTGVSVAPASAGGVSCQTFDGIWFEGAGQSHFAMDSTVGPISRVVFSNCRAATAQSFSPTVVEVISGIAFRDSELTGIDFTLPANCDGWTFANTKIAEVTFSGGLRPSFDNCAQTTPANCELTQLVCDTEPMSVLYDVATVDLDWRESGLRLIFLEHDVGGGDVDVTINLPTNAPEGARLTLVIKQRGGMRKVAWQAGYRVNWLPAWEAASSPSTVVQLVYADSQWHQAAAQPCWTGVDGAPVLSGAAKSVSTAIDDTDSPYDITADDHFIRADTSGGNPITINLPAVADSANRWLLVGDWGGTAATDNITLAAQSGETVDGLGSIDITADGGAVNLYCDGTEWRSVPTA
jgi:hypothetical protein